MSTYPRRRLLGALVALLLVAPVPASAQPAGAAAAATPVTVPALANWTPEQGSYQYGSSVRLVADTAPERRVADTLADDLRDTGHGTVPVVSGGARAGDIVIDVRPGRAALGAEGYELRAGARLSVTGATETGAFYGTRTLLQLLAQGETIPAGRTVDVPRYAERGVGVCACYVHISTPWLENLVRDMAFQQAQPAASRTQGEERRSSRGQHLGLLHQGRDPTARRPGREVPRRDRSGDRLPGHMDPWIENRPDLQLTDSDGNKQPSRLDITQPAAFDYYTSLIDEYAQVFTGGSWHMGADEYMLGSDFAKYPQVLRYAREKYGADATPQDAFIDFVNRVQTYLAAKGRKLRIWNDGLTGANTVPVTAGTTVEHWLNVAVKPSQLIAQGYPLMNAAYALYLVRGGFHTDTKALYDQSWDPRSFEGEKLASSKGITGAKISLWPDNGRGETENEVAVDTDPALRHVAQATWGDPHPDATYAEFTARGTAVGHAPGWRDLTRVPVADGTYTLGAGAVSLTVDVRRTDDGYVTLRTGAGCLEVRGGKLTLNTPLQPGVEVSAQTCDATNTVERWELVPAAGGYRLVNAITRMAVHVGDDGRLVQYPPDQRPPAVWHLTTVH